MNALLKRENDILHKRRAHRPRTSREPGATNTGRSVRQLRGWSITASGLTRSRAAMKSTGTGNTRNMSEPDQPAPRPSAATPKLPDVESPPPEDVLDGVPSKEQIIEDAEPADEIVEQ
jgi:hypothetical protein